MDCEHAYTALKAAIQSSSTPSPGYDRLEVFLTAIGIAVAVLVGFFTIASVVLAVFAIFGWRQMMRAARNAAHLAVTNAAEEVRADARKWAEIYSDPVKMFKHFGMTPKLDSQGPPQPDPAVATSPPGIPSTSQASKDVGEELVEALADESETLGSQLPVGETLPRKEELDGERPEATTEPKPESESEQCDDGSESKPE